MSDFKELKVWQKAHALALAELKRFLRISIASAYELESHLIMGRDLRFLSEADFVRLTEQLIEVRKMLFGLAKYLGSTRA